MKPNKKIVLLSVLLFSFVLFPVKNIFASSPAEISLTVSQKFEVKNPPENADLTGNYTFQALDKNIPVPEGSQSGKYTFSLKGKKSTATLRLSFTKAGTYRYELFQTTKDKKFYTYDRSRYTITIYIENDDNGTLAPQVVVQKEDGKKYGSVQFQNSCTGTAPETSVTPTPGGNGNYGGGGSGSQNPGSYSSSSPVKTGDTTDIMPFVLTGSIALLLIAVLSLLKKKTVAK